MGFHWLILIFGFIQDSHPGGHFRVGCEHHFVWSTEAGCPITETVGNNCTVTNPETGQLNLSVIPDEIFCPYNFIYVLKISEDIIHGLFLDKCF